MKNKFISLICAVLTVTNINMVPIAAKEEITTESPTITESTSTDDSKNSANPEETEVPADKNDSEEITPAPSATPEGQVEPTESPEPTTSPVPTESPEPTETPSVEESKEKTPEETVSPESDLDEEINEDDIMTLSEGDGPSVAENTTLTYIAHAQRLGWMNAVHSKEIAGTTGQSRGLEAIKIALPQNLLASGSISVQAHVQSYGWQNAVGNDQLAGTTGQNRSIEALRISLTGALANQYDIIYRAHVQSIGWQKWVRNGAVAGTTGQSRRIEAVQIYLRDKSERVPIGSIDKTIYYTAHAQSIGWMSTVTNGSVAGTTGRSKNLEALQVCLNDDMLDYGNISVQAHVQSIGWMNPVGNEQVAGTTGQSKGIEGLKISLTGELANYYDIYYRAHVSGIGWLGWTMNGNLAGSVGCNRRIEAVQISVYAKNDPNAPKVSTSSTNSVNGAQNTPTYYSQRDSRWAGATYNGYNLQSTGCVPTAVAMAVDGILHNGVTPKTMADYLVTTGEFAGRKHGGSGLAIKYGAEHYGLKTIGISSYNGLLHSLETGDIVVFQVGAGTFTSRGSTHAIVLFRNSGGNTYVYDPWNAHNGWYSISMIWNQRSTNSYDLTGGYVGYGIYQ